MEHYLEQLDLTEMMTELDSFFPSFSGSMAAVFEQIMAGKWQESGRLLLQGIMVSVKQEVTGMKGILVSILILGLLSALISGFLDSFENHQIAEIAHYIFYLLLLAVILKIFAAGFATAQQVLSEMARFSKLVLPALCLSLGPAAGTVTAAGYYELALVLISCVEHFLLQLCLPFLPVFMMLLVMNGVWEEGKLSALMELLEKGLAGAARISLGTVTGLGVLQSMVAPALDGLKRSAAQRAVSAIPALGNLAEGTTQLLVGSAVLIKNSLGLFALLLLLCLVAVPFLKLFLYGALLKLGSALFGIVADKRLTACVSRTADALFLTLRLAASGAACFLILTAIITCLTGRG